MTKSQLSVTRHYSRLQVPCGITPGEECLASSAGALSLGLGPWRAAQHGPGRILIRQRTSAPKGVVRFWQKGRRTRPARYHQWCYFFLLLLRPQAFKTTWLQTGTRRALHIYLPACISSFGRRHRRLTIAPQSPTVVQTEKRFVPFPEYQTKLIEQQASNARPYVSVLALRGRWLFRLKTAKSGNWWPERPAWVPMNKGVRYVCESERENAVRRCERP